MAPGSSYAVSVKVMAARMMFPCPSNGLPGLGTPAHRRATGSTRNRRQTAALEQPGHEGRGVRNVGLLGAREIGELDLEEPVVGRPAPIAQESAEHRVAVEARQAGPDDGPVRVDQRRDARVPDQSEVEAGHDFSLRSTKRLSHARTASAFGNRPFAAELPSPTLTAQPPTRLISSHPNSSL